MKKLLGILAIAAFAFPIDARAQRTESDSAQLARLVAMEIQFFLDWRSAWMSVESVDRENARRKLVARTSRNPPLDVRYARLYRLWDTSCALANTHPPAAATGYSNVGRIIESSTRPFSKMGRLHRPIFCETRRSLERALHNFRVLVGANSRCAALGCVDGSHASSAAVMVCQPARQLACARRTCQKWCD
jgi:hypothetical protein